MAVTLKKNLSYCDEERTLYDVYNNNEYTGICAFAYPGNGAYWCDELGIEHCDTYPELVKELNKSPIPV
jgi:hypothetical protein